MDGGLRAEAYPFARYAKQIEDIFAEAGGFRRLGHSVSGLSDKPFSFDDYPMAKARMDALVESMHDDLLAGVENGIDAEWALANGQADELVAGMLTAAKLGKAVTPDRWLNNHAEALEAFKRRKIAGLGLSDRVWNYTGQFREEIEMALDLGIRSGRSAAEMSRDVRQYLRYPDKLFRRVRDEHGNLRLSKAAKEFHPGQGVYRSSYKNALRLTATETNIAYRTADFLRVQDLDFVVGIEVRLSNNHTLNGRPFFDICDELAGRYPKDFKFTGWHPLCRCHSIKILKTEEEFFADEQRLLAGEELGGESVNRVGDVPPRFKEWVRDNRERIGKARAKGTESYFIRDNKAYVDGILDPKPNALLTAEKRHSARTEEQAEAIRKSWNDRVLDSQIKEAIAQSVANKYGAFCTPINYKTAESIKRKVLLERKSPIKAWFLPSDLKDTARTTIIAERNKIDEIINSLSREEGVKNLGRKAIKRQYGESYIGYTGNIVNIKMPNGIICEIQVNTPKMIYAKEEPTIAKNILGETVWNAIRKETGLVGGLGHKYYEQWRLLDKNSIETQKIAQKSMEYYSHFTK